MQPTQGQTYTAATKNAALVIESVEIVPADDGDPATFFVTACYPDDAGDISASSIEMSEDEWNDYCAEHGLTLKTSP